jgi:hypothetical protein
MAGVTGWLMLSGYLLYYVGDDTARSVISVLHWTIGLAAPVVFFMHRVKLPYRRPLIKPKVQRGEQDRRTSQVPASTAYADSAEQ